jgi:hypothetical protein
MPTVTRLLTVADIRNDLRFLGGIDCRHAFLENVPDRWFENKGYILLSERAGDGTPLVGVALEYPLACPIDATADMYIRYWVANLNRKPELDAAFVKNIIAINDEMAALGVRRVWGLVPKKSSHLRGFLDRVADAGACQRVDGAGVTVGVAEDEAGGDYRNFNFYIGDRQAVTDFMQGRR